MKRILFLIFCFIITNLNSLEISIKDKVIVNNRDVLFKDIVNGMLPKDLENILITRLNSPSQQLKNNDILNEIMKRGFYDITLSGKEIIIYYNDFNLNKKKYKDIILPLQEHISNLLDPNFNIKVSVKNISPYIDITKIEDNFVWEIEKFNKGLKDISNLRSGILKIGDNKYNADLDLSIYANVIVAKKSFIPDELVDKLDIYSKNIDITNFKDVESLVLGFSNLDDYKFKNMVKTGELIRWENLKKVPIVQKGDNLKIVYNKNGFEIVVSGTALKDGYKDEKIRVKLFDGRERSGFLRKNDGSIYVEI